MRKFLKMFVMTSAFAAHGACDDVIWLLSGAPDEEEETMAQVETLDVDAEIPALRTVLALRA